METINITMESNKYLSVLIASINMVYKIPNKYITYKTYDL